jgi:hypothetical protein
MDRVVLSVNHWEASDTALTNVRGIGERGRGMEGVLEVVLLLVSGATGWLGVSMVWLFTWARELRGKLRAQRSCEGSSCTPLCSPSLSPLPVGTDSTWILGLKIVELIVLGRTQKKSSVSCTGSYRRQRNYQKLVTRENGRFWQLRTGQGKNRLHFAPLECSAEFVGNTGISGKSY